MHEVHGIGAPTSGPVVPPGKLSERRMSGLYAELEANDEDDLPATGRFLRFTSVRGRNKADPRRGRHSEIAYWAIGYRDVEWRESGHFPQDHVCGPAEAVHDPVEHAAITDRAPAGRVAAAGARRLPGGTLCGRTAHAPRHSRSSEWRRLRGRNTGGAGACLSRCLS
jgi:hypothetical protein